MGSLLSRSVEIRISNKTKNITLNKHKIFYNSGYCSAAPLSELSPGSRDSCHFQGIFPISDVAGLLVYEAESFTLAIHFSNPLNHITSSMVLGLELSPGKAHLGSLQDTYTRMANGAYCRSRLDMEFDRITVDRGQGTVQVSHRNVKVTATMSSASDCILTVELEEEGGWREEPGPEKPRGGKHYQEK